MNPEAPSIQIVADDRENAGGVIEVLRARPKILVKVQRLTVGDFLIEQKIIAERKTLRDFAASVVDGRWFRQVASLTGVPYRAAVILEGTIDKELGVTRDALQGALITASVFYGVAVLRARDQVETAKLLVYIGRQASRALRGALPRHGYRPKGKRARQAFILQGIPGIGPERAGKLLDRFGSVTGVVNASPAELAAIDGIGDVTAQKMRWAVEEAAGDYDV